MKTNAEKSLDLIIKVEKLNQEFRKLSEKIGIHTGDCFNEKLKTHLSGEDWPEPCLTDWLERKFEYDYNNCPVTGREYEVKIPYWTATQMTESDCPHCYAALKLIEQRKLLKKERGVVKAQITKLAKREILKIEGLK